MRWLPLIVAQSNGEPLTLRRIALWQRGATFVEVPPACDME